MTLNDRAVSKMIRQAERHEQQGEPLPADLHAALIAEGIDASLYAPSIYPNQKDFDHA
mgnify:CR=1 FL=1